MNKPRRVVSIGEYVAHKCRYSLKAGTAYVLLMLGLTGITIGILLVLAILVLWLTYWSRDAGTETWTVLLGLFISGLGIALALLIVRGGTILYNAVDQMEPVVLLHSANADLLPAAEVLVRAAS